MNKEDIIGFILYFITIIGLSYVITITINSCNKTKDSNRDTIKQEEVIKQNLEDSITVIKIKENEEIKIVRDADNDSTLFIFKRLVSE